MTLRRLLPLFTLVALMIAPFGRMGMAEAAMPQHAAPMAMPGHCEDMPTPASGKPSKAAIDCMIACAAVATQSAAELVYAVSDPITVAPRPLFSLDGIEPEAADPPPRVS